MNTKKQVVCECLTFRFDDSKSFGHVALRILGRACIDAWTLKNWHQNRLICSFIQVRRVWEVPAVRRCRVS